ncbi:MAG: hypothetical protein IJU16_04075 [Clostridia bacterium]|nr:hypothetical protein [Clostridia bacterium]
MKRIRLSKHTKILSALLITAAASATVFAGYLLCKDILMKYADRVREIGSGIRSILEKK